MPAPHQDRYGSFAELNRSKQGGQGVQLELPSQLRGGPREALLVDAVREILLTLPA